MRLVIVISLITLLAGCAATPPSSIEEAYKKTTFEVDEYSKTRVLRGPYVSISFGIDGGGGIYLRKVNNSYQLYVTTFSQLGWCFFESAFDKNAGKLAFTNIRSNVGRGVTYEDFYLSITKEQLEVMAAKGLDVRIYGTNRTIDVALPAIYVQGFMRRAAESS
jgi:hypothetical protein